MRVPPGANQFLLIVTISTLFVLGGLIGLSVYYRFYLIQKKRVPFTAPLFLQFLFPRPTNFETEISALCSKYMNEP